MKQSKKTLVLCAIIVFVIAAILTLSACTKTPKVESISVEIIGGGEKIELTPQNASADTIISKINVFAQLSDETSEQVTDISVEDFDSTKLDTVQTVTIRFGEFTATVSVQVKSPAPVEPKIVSIAASIDGDKITLQQANATEAAILAKVTVTATLDNNTTRKITEGLTLQGFDASKLNTVQTVTVKYDKFTTTVLVVVEGTTPVEPKIVSIAVEFNGDKITLQQANATEAAILAKVTVTATLDNNTTRKITEGLTVEGFDAAIVNTDQSIVVKYGEFSSQAFKVVVESTSSEVVVTDIRVTIDGDKVTMNKETASEQILRSAITVKAVKSDDSSETITDYEVTGLDLTKVDEEQTVTIKYGEFTKTITVLIEDNSEPAPDTYAVYIVVNDNEAGKTALTLNTNASDPSEKFVKEYMGSVTLAVGDTVVIIDSDGHEFINYQSESPFKGEAKAEGQHNFYVKIYTDGDSVYATSPNGTVEPNPDTYAVYVIVNGDTENKITLVINESNKTENLKAEYFGTVTLVKGDTVVIKDSDDNTFIYYEDACPFKGTANKDGAHTFYVKKWQDGGHSIWVSEPETVKPVVTELSTNVTGTLVLYGVQADDIKAALTVTATWNVGDPSVVTNYTVTGYDKTILGEEQTVKLTLGDASVEIAVKVMEAYIESINATINGEAIELIGAKATAANILKAITAVTATLNDGTTRENVKSQCTVDESTFNATQYGTTQQVKICLGEINTTVPVKVTAATAESLQLSTQSVTVTGTNENEVITAIKAKIAVNVIMTDGETKLNATYTVALATGFDFANVTTAQSATITCDGLTSTISVKMIMGPKSIAPNVNAITILESSASETARLAAVKAQLVVTLTMTDNSTDTITDYDVAFGSFSASNYEAQTVTISYEGVESITISVTVKAVPKIAVNSDAATFMTVDATNENRYVSGDIDLEHGDVVAITLAGQAVAFTGDFNGTAAINGTHTFAVTVGETTTIAVTEPAYVATLKVGGVAQAEPTVASGVYTWTVTLARGNVVTITDNMFGTLQINGSAQYTATRDGQYTITVTRGATANTVAVTVPEYAVTLTVTRGEEVVNTVVLDLSNERPDGCKAQYVASQLELKKNDVVAITDNDGNTHNNYQWTSFAGTAPHDGKYDFYVKVFDNSASNNIYVAVPAKVVAISVNGGTPVALALDENKNEYYIRKVALNSGDTVAILDGGEVYTNWKGVSALTVNAGTATAKTTGDYNFYVQFEGDDTGIWGELAPIEKGVTISVNGGTPVALNLDESKNEYYIRWFSLNSGDTVVIKVDGVAYTNWKSVSVLTAQKGTAEATAKSTGKYDFYIQLEGYDIGIWAQSSPAEVTITVGNGSPVRLDLDTNKNEYFITGVMLQEGETVVIKVDGVDYANYKACGFNGTATATGNHDFYVDLNSGIWVTHP